MTTPAEAEAIRQGAIMEANGPWVEATTEAMLGAVSHHNIVGEPSETTLAMMTACAAAAVAFSVLRGQFGDDAKVRAMLSDLFEGFGVEENAAMAG